MGRVRDASGLGFGKHQTRVGSVVLLLQRTVLVFDTLHLLSVHGVEGVVHEDAVDGRSFGVFKHS